jgi:2-polyprenyl-3-methyl-5-hydroxy-6-metoxy-1,4-benzoquinol methylase
MERVIDLGCGPSKTPGAVGFDHHPFAGVDVVGDLDTAPWPFPDSSFDRVVCSHVIEHVADPAAFLGEIHRIARPGALVEVTTPHFSAQNSWNDPTHRWHYGAFWYEPLLEGGYLGARTGRYACVSTGVEFGRSVLEWLPRLVVRLRGLRHWERRQAFSLPGGHVRTVLRVLK